MRSILAVSDLTPASDGALSAAAVLAARTGAELHVVHSMEVVGMPLWEAIQTDVGRRIEDAESALAEQVRRTIPDGLAPASCALAFQNVHDSVLLRGREVRADLIVFGAADPRTSGGARHLRALQDVAGVAAAPCLLVRNPLDPPLVRVLLPLSVTEIGQGVLADACAWLTLLEPAPAQRPATELQVLHVASGPREWRELAPDFDREVRRAGDQRQWNARLRIRRSIRWGEAAHMEILRVAAVEAPDLVLLGPGCGVANSPEFLKDARAVLLRRLPCSVLVLPGTLRSDDETDGLTPPPEFEPADAGEPEPVGAMQVAGADERAERPGGTRGPGRSCTRHDQPSSFRDHSSPPRRLRAPTGSYLHHPRRHPARPPGGRNESVPPETTP